MIATVTVAAWACGPEFPNRYLDAPDEALLEAPRANFADEVARIVTSLPEPRRARMTTRVEIVAADIAELREALRAGGMVELRILEVVADYERERVRLEEAVSSETGEELRFILPEETPSEFVHYLEGAAAWSRGRSDLAREAWERLLALPAEQRRYRTTWATFMIGRAWEELACGSVGDERARAAAQARSWFERTRAEVDSGAADSIGLSIASLGRQARVELRCGHPERAIELYARQHAAGDATALNSLSFTVNAAVGPSVDDAMLTTLARDGVVRQIVTAWMLSRAEAPWQRSWREQNLELLGRWARTLLEIGTVEVDGAERLAWLAYRAGSHEASAAWARLAPGEAPLSLWIRAKLALRAGELSEAEALLVRATVPNGLPASQRLLAQAELGRVRLALDDRPGALIAWLDGGHWEDAAYVAERLMSLVELQGFVDTECSTVEPLGDDGWRDADPRKTRGYLRYLLARRLTREGATDLAERHFPESLRGEFCAYREAVRSAFESARPAEERARAFWTAARLMRERGVALWATELEPDWAISGVMFDRGRASDARLQLAGLMGPTADERDRLTQHRAERKRFSYRYRAAALAWWAASLLPNESEETATVLHTAGSWLRARDPEAAEPFYQALVIRCGTTSLGRAAAAKHWFPGDISASTDAVSPP